MPALAHEIAECIPLCASGGGVPACPRSDEENAWFADIARAEDMNPLDWHWLGKYQTPTNPMLGEYIAPADGWDHCVGGGATNYTNWWVDPLTAEVQPPDDMFGDEKCTALAVFPSCDGAWIDSTCALAILTEDGARPCLCATGEATMQGQIHAYVIGAYYPRLIASIQDDARNAYAIAAGVWAVAVLFLAVSDASVRRLVCHRRSSAQQQASSATEKRLNDSLDAAARVRVKVSFAMRVVGLLMYTLGHMPWWHGLIRADRPRMDLVIGANTYHYTFIAWPGLVLLLLSLMPSDTVLIRVVCALMFAFCLLSGALLLLLGLDFTPISSGAPLFMRDQSFLGSRRDLCADLQLPLVSAAPDAPGDVEGLARHVLSGRAA